MSKPESQKKCGRSGLAGLDIEPSCFVLPLAFVIRISSFPEPPGFPCVRWLMAQTKCSLAPRSRVPRVAQTIPQETQRQQSRSQRDAWKNNHPPVGADRVDLRRAFGDERAEARLRRLNPHPEVTQKRFIQDDGRNRQRQVSHDDAVKGGPKL